MLQYKPTLRSEVVLVKRLHSPTILLRWAVLLALLVTPALACRLLSGSSNSGVQTGRVLFQDDFSNPDSGWNRANTSRGETDYADGAYRILVNEPNVDIWSKAGREFTDVRIEVDAFKVGGDRDNRFGVICRAVDATNFYTFIISSDGYYGIGKIKGEQYQLIGMDSLQPSEAIHLGSAFNHIRADCVGSTLTMYVNGKKLAEVQDSEFASGDVGLIAGTYQEPGTDVRFNNFIVYQPESLPAP
jgi:hypothetical protein